MKRFLKYPLILLFGISMAGCGLMNNAMDDNADEGRDTRDEDMLDADDRYNRDVEKDGVKIKGDQERPQGLG